MIERIVRLSLQQRLLVVIIAIALLVAGLLATKRLSVDALSRCDQCAGAGGC
jgi:cobalt-zinc-cadmium resistance protein CzcA